jgi:carbamoyltransferase
MKILGISAYYHDSAACLIDDGVIIAAAQEERFTRKKHDARFPVSAINFCLNYVNLQPSQIDYIVFYDKPFLKFERLLETYLAFAPKGFRSFSQSMPLWIKDKLFQKLTILNTLKDSLDSSVDWKSRLLFSEHHLSHAASAFYPSPFDEAAILTMDGVGEWTTTSLAVGRQNVIEIQKEIHFPHSLGLLYSAMTYYTGFKVNSGEYKVMGLAPYGEPRYVDLIKENLINIAEDGSFFMDMSYFDYCTGLTMTSDKFHTLFGAPPRKPNQPLSQRDMDLAASVQSVTEEVVIKLCKNIAQTTKQRNLCLAGGVALNCVANGKLLKEKIFENIWTQPAAGDAGGAIGAALSAYHLHLNQPRNMIVKKDGMQGSYLGPQYSQSEVEAQLSSLSVFYEVLSEEEMLSRTAKDLALGKAVGWHQSRMEFGPRSLGCRSILADPRSPTIQKQLNLKVKFRESFRPFAPAVLRNDVSEWFEIDTDSPYMLFVAPISKDKQVDMSECDRALFGIDKLNVVRSSIPAVTHIDYSARIQTVHEDTNRLFSELLKKFKEITGCPVLVNTSFNVRGEPIVESPKDAFDCFVNSDIDILVIGNCYLDKTKIQNLDVYRQARQFELD